VEQGYGQTGETTVCLERSAANVIVHGADESLLALVVIRNGNPLSTEAAIGVRRHLSTDGMLSTWARFVLIVSQEAGFLWSQDRLAPSTDDPPSACFPVMPVVERYLPEFADRPRLTRTILESALTQWLWSMVWDGADRPAATEAPISTATDFVRLMKGARVTTNDRD
jgi:hypothetical protein